jgi:integrase
MKRKATDIRRRDLRQTFDAVADKGHKAAAEKQRSMVQAMFRWALRQDIIEVDPSAGLSVYGQPVARERVLDQNEIRELWSWLETGDMPAHVADTLKLQLCLGARVGEVCGMMAEELKHDGSDRLLWNLPAARSKNGSGRVTPILGLALEIIERRLKTTNDGRLFVSETGTPQTGGLVGMAIIARRARAPIAHFSSHDLRRTTATGMAKLGLPLDLIAIVLGHEAGGASETRTLRKHYVHDQFVDRKTSALAAWDRRLRAILTGEEGKVIPLRA